MLCGGESRRMGRDKAELRLGGITLLERTVRELMEISGDVILVGRSTRLERIRSIPDEIPGRGPVSGLRSGLRAARLPLCVVVACDLPFLSGAALRCLLDLSAGFDTVVPLHGGHPHPLHAVYRRDILPDVDGYLAQGGRSMRGLLERLRVRWVSQDEMSRIDPSGRSLINVNSPEEWKEINSQTEDTGLW